MSTTPKVAEGAESLTVIGTEYAIRGTLYRYGKWEYRTEQLSSGLNKLHANRAAEGRNDLLRAAGREPDVEVMTATLYRSEWQLDKPRA